MRRSEEFWFMVLDFILSVFVLYAELYFKHVHAAPFYEVHDKEKKINVRSAS